MQNTMERRETRFSDVCGTTDELKWMLVEDYEAVVSDPDAAALPLLDDAVSMVRRMHERLLEYEEFREKFRRICSQLDEIEGVDLAPAETASESFRDCVKRTEPPSTAPVARLAEWAEAIRIVAGDQENTLRRYKDLALEIHELFSTIKGDRAWLASSDDSQDYALAVRARYQAWLPPEPHAEKLLGFLRDSRAYVVGAPAPGTEPEVQFEDGGRIPMSQVRYDENIENFHPARHRPVPSAKEYRHRSTDCQSVVLPD